MRIEIFSKYCQKIVNEVKRKILLQWSPKSKSHKGRTFWLRKRRKMESNPIFFLLLPNTGWFLNGSMWVSRYYFLSWVRPHCCLGCRRDGTFSLRLSRGQENWDPDTPLPLLNWVASCESFYLSLTFLICDMKGLNLTPLLLQALLLLSPKLVLHTDVCFKENLKAGVWALVVYRGQGVWRDQLRWKR